MRPVRRPASHHTDTQQASHLFAELWLQAALSSLAIASAVLFVLAFAPPAALRSWWRRHATAEFERMQADLITATTPQEVADAAVPRVAAMLGSSVALLDADGEVLAGTGPGRPPSSQRAGAGTDDTRVLDVGSLQLLVRTTPYTPLFGRDEEQLTAVLARQIGMAYERSALQTEALRAREELQALLLGLAHDLRNPAVAIKGFADLLLDDPPDRFELTGHLQRSAVHLHRLIDAVLDLARVGRTEPRLEPVDLTAVAEDVAERAGASHPQVHIEVLGDASPIAFDAVRATQMVENLVVNAIAHGGRADLAITVEVAEVASGTVTLSVADDGVGVADDDRERIFDVFHRGRGAATGGNGLGLALVRRIVATAGGTIELAPSPHGARFVVTLPRGADTTDAGEEVADATGTDVA